MPVGSIIGGLIGQGGAQAAAGRAGQAAGNADFMRRHGEALLSPWSRPGTSAQNLISQLLGFGTLKAGDEYGNLIFDESNREGDQQNAFAQFKQSPDYNFRLQQGQKALDQSAASRGNLLSGKQVKASQEYGGNLASGEYNNWFGKLMQESQLGLQGATGQVGAGLQMTNAGNNALLAQGGFEQAGANALANGIMSGTRNLLSIGAFGLGGGFSGGGGVRPGPAPAGGYGGYAGYANTLPGFL